MDLMGWMQLEKECGRELVCNERGWGEICLDLEVLILWLGPTSFCR